MREELLDHPHRPAQVDLDLARHVFQGVASVEVQVPHDPGLVDARVEAGEGALGLGQLPPVPAGDQDRAAALEELPRQLKADAARPARDQGGLFVSFIRGSSRSGP